MWDLLFYYRTQVSINKIVSVFTPFIADRLCAVAVHFRDLLPDRWELCRLVKGFFFLLSLTTGFQSCRSSFPLPTITSTHPGSHRDNPLASALLMSPPFLQLIIAAKVKYFLSLWQQEGTQRGAGRDGSLLVFYREWLLWPSCDCGAERTEQAGVGKTPPRPN